MDLKNYIRDIPDYPKPGIVFKDITPLLMSPDAMRAAVDGLKTAVAGLDIEKICAIESRGFLFGAPLALSLGVGLIPVRKPGKLPWKTLSQEYALEYGADKLEIHVDAVTKGERILIVDDLLATGGTAAAVCKLIRRMEATVTGLAFVTELSFLKGRAALKGYDARSLIRY